MNKRNKLLQLAVFIVSVMALSGKDSFGQNTIYSVSNKFGNSPGVDALIKEANVNVDFFHGMPVVGVPLYTVEGDRLQHNLSLVYNTGGVKVNEKPTWVGLSWNLDGDAQIVRKVNHVHDETYSFLYKRSGVVMEKGYYFTSDQLNTPNWLDQSFLDNAVNSMLAESPSTIDQVVLDGEPDEFVFNFGEYSGSFFRSETGTWKVKSKQNLDLKIEEELHTYQYNQADYYRFNSNNWTSVNYTRPIVATLFTKFTITVPDGTKYIFGGVDSAIEFCRGIMPYEPVISDPVSKHASELITANVWKLSKIIGVDGEEIDFTYNRGKVLYNRDRTYKGGVSYSEFATGNSGWEAALDYAISIVYPVYLSKIETRKSIVAFKRSQAIEDFIKPLPQHFVGYSLAARGDYCNNNYDYNMLTARGEQGIDYALAPIMSPSPRHLGNFAQQLDSIILFDKIANQYVNGYHFIHSSDPTIRRTLDSIKKFNYQDNTILNLYSFEYDQVDQIAPYESLTRDYWGYMGSNTNTLLGSNQLARAELYYDEMPLLPSASSTRGMLKKMINPLGGSLEFTYEPNQYSQKVKVDALMNTIGTEQLTGYNFGSGSRVSKITRKDYFGAPDVVTRYDYTSDYPHSGTIGTSSGLLNADLIEDIIRVRNCPNNNTEMFMMDFGTDMYDEFIDQFKGGIINYSQVNEINADGSYTTYKFSNADNPLYRDELAAGKAFINIVFQHNYRISSTDMDRGNLLSKTMFNVSNQKVKEVINTYEYNPNRKNQFIKAMSHKTTANGTIVDNNVGVGCTGAAPSLKKRLWAYKIYTYNNPLIKKEERIYNPDGLTYISNEVNYEYDAYGNITKESVTNSTGDLEVNVVKYNSHPDYSGTASTDVALGIKNLLTNYGIKSYPIEQLSILTLNNGGAPPSYIRSGAIFNYQADKPILAQKFQIETETTVPEYNAVISPGGLKSSVLSSGDLIKDSRYQLSEKVLSTTYNPIFNYKPTTVTNTKDTVALLYDYKGFYLCAIAQNAQYAEVAYSGFEGEYTGVYSELTNGVDVDDNNIVSTGALCGSKAYKLPQTLIGNPSGLSLAVNMVPGKSYVLSFWAKVPPANSTVIIKDATNMYTYTPVVKAELNDWKYYELNLSSTTSAVSICNVVNGAISFDVLLDEVMLYPQNGSMESRNYNSGTGKVTVINKGNGMLQYYIYDGLGRLLEIKDQDGHILKSYEYQYQTN